MGQAITDGGEDMTDITSDAPALHFLSKINVRLILWVALGLAFCIVMGILGGTYHEAAQLEKKMAYQCLAEKNKKISP